MRDIKYFLYARKSSESEDRQMASIDDQIMEVKKIADKSNLQIIDIISESKSAKGPGREGFNLMLRRIQKGEAQGILTWKLNRLARNPVDGGQISWLLQTNVIKHIQTFEREYYPTDNVLMMQVEFGMANQYVKDLSLDVKRGLRQKAERGWFPSTRLPVGYMHNHPYTLGLDDEIISNPKQFPILKKLWRLFASGKYTIAEIKRIGDKLGLCYKSNSLCSQNTYYRIFTNEFYCGYFYWNDKDGNVVRYKGKHKAMISPSEFQKVQIRLTNKAKSTSQGKSYNFPYRGIIKCGECGCSVVPDHKLQVICTKCKYKFSVKTRSDCPKCGLYVSQMDNPSIIDILYYHCSKSRGKCSQGSITKNDIEVTIEKELKKISIDEKIHEWAIRSLVNKKKNEDLKNIIKNLKRRKTELEERLSELIILRADREINSKQFNLLNKRTEKELFDVNVELIEANKNNADWHTDQKKCIDIALEAIKKFRNGDDFAKSEMVCEFSSNLTLKDKNLVFSMKKPFIELQDDISAYSSKN